MRRFKDREGSLWDVVIGRESWGTHCALFVPAGRDAAIRQTVLEAASFDDAVAGLDRLDDSQLQRLLDNSKIKEG